MSTLRAVLLYPVRPGDSARVLAGRPLLALAPLVPALAFSCILLTKGVVAADALVAGLGAALVLSGLTVGGALASWPAARLAGSRVPLRSLAAPCAVAACWAALLTVLAARVLGGLGSGPLATLLAALLVLLHGAAAGYGIVRADEAGDVGRGGVASCLGLAGALAGAWLALLAVQGSLVFVLRAPVTLDDFRAGELLVVRRVDRASPGSLVFLRDRGGREGLFARIDARGAARPLGSGDAAAVVSTDWDIHGRVLLVAGEGGWRSPDATKIVPR